MLHITSRQNERVKAVLKLRNSRHRAEQGRFVIDGARASVRAVEAGIEIVEAFLCEPLIDTPESHQAAELLREASAPVSTVTPEVYAKLAFGDNHDGLVAVAVTPQRKLTQLPLGERPLIAVLEGLEKPGNVGAILRSADAAGVDATIVADGVCDLFNPNTIRASMGTVFAGNVCAASVEETLTQLQAWNLPIVAARPDADRLYTDIDYRAGAAIVLGSEAQGLSKSWQGGEVQAVRLPMHGIADSLNVSATAAILFYEALRQRSG